MNAVADNLWESSQPLRLGLVKLEHRMTVARLGSGELWVHSPVELTPETRQAIDALGPVGHIVAPSTFHDMYLEEWTAAYPEARFHAAPGVQNEHRSWPITDEISPTSPPSWSDEIQSLVLAGMPRINETVFLHQPSGTLIVADLVFNLTDWPMDTISSLTFRMFGTYQQLAVSRLFRLFAKDRGALKDSLNRMLDWDFDRVLVGHGRPIEQGGRQAMRGALSVFGV